MEWLQSLSPIAFKCLIVTDPPFRNEIIGLREVRGGMKGGPLRHSDNGLGYEVSWPA